MKAGPYFDADSQPDGLRAEMACRANQLGRIGSTPRETLDEGKVSSCAASLNLSLPAGITSVAANVSAEKETTTSGKILQELLNAGSNILVKNAYDKSYPAIGEP